MFADLVLFISSQLSKLMAELTKMPGLFPRRMAMSMINMVSQSKTRWDFEPAAADVSEGDVRNDT